MLVYMLIKDKATLKQSAILKIGLSPNIAFDKTLLKSQCIHTGLFMLHLFIWLKVPECCVGKMIFVSVLLF